MNTLGRETVVSAMLVTSLVGAACVAVHGGAVELAWTTRTVDGRPVTNLAVQGFATVKLCIQGGCDPSGVCSGQADCHFEFPYDRERGSTDFSIPPGRTKLWIEPTCATGLTLQGVTVPEPLVRDITTGDVTELNALLISVPSTGSACVQANGA